MSAALLGMSSLAPGATVSISENDTDSPTKLRKVLSMIAALIPVYDILISSP